MSLIISFRSELIKMRRTSAWYIAVFIALLTPLTMCSDYYSQLPEELAQGNPWNYFLLQGFQLMTILALPFMVILICTVVAQIEYRNHTWKQVMASPQQKLNIYLAKYGAIILLIILFFICHTIAALIVGYVIDAGPGNGRFSMHPIPFSELFTLLARALVCALGFTAFQFWLALRFRNFIAPIAIGMVIWFIGGMISMELRLPWGDWHPYMLAGYSMFDKFRDQWAVLILKSVVFCLVFLSVGYIDFRSGKVKE